MSLQRYLIISATTLSLAGGMIGCTSASKKSPETNAKIERSTKKELKEIAEDQPSLHNFLKQSYGYAVFPLVAKGGLIVGGAYAWGEVFEQSVSVGYSDMVQGSVGLQIGGQTATEVLAFKDKAAFERFKTDKFTLAGNATAIILTHGASKDTKLEYTDGVAVFLLPKEGAMAEAAIAGQTFLYKSKADAMKE